MSLQPEDRKQIVNYLLGRLAEEEMSALERRYFQDAAYLELFEVVEDELIDSYLRGELSDEEAQHFQAHYLRSPERRRKVEFADAFLRSLPSSRGSFRLHYALIGVAAVLITAVVVGVWIRRPSPSPTPAIVLVPGDRDIEKRKNLVIPPGAVEIPIQVELETISGPHAWRAVLRTPDEAEVLRLAVDRVRQFPAQTSVDLRLPVKTLIEGDFILQIEAAAPGADFHTVGSYFVRIVRR